LNEKLLESDNYNQITVGGLVIYFLRQLVE